MRPPRLKPDEISIGVVMPTYDGWAQVGATCGYAHCRAGSYRVQGLSLSMSNLPQLFNSFFAHLLDERDRGHITHMAMLHADVEPERGWLSILLEEMRVHNADVISAVVAIKEPERSRTSTAIGDIADPWAQPKRYIRLQDRESLPVTFGPDDVCGPGEELLVNTGCFLMDLRRDYWTDAGDGRPYAFHFKNRINVEAKPPDQLARELVAAKHDEIVLPYTRQAQLRPEDWEMSRYLRSIGAPYRATWRVNTIHHGNAQWSNWIDGEDVDVAAANDILTAAGAR